MAKRIYTSAFLLILLFSISKTIGQIPFELNDEGHILIKAKINGVEGKFVFDTGGGLNVIFTKFSQKIENKKTPNFFVGHRATGEELSVDLHEATSLEINNKVFDHQQYAIVDLEFGDIDGLISLQPFRNTPFTINYITKEILFDKSTKNEKSIDIQLMDYAGRAIDIFTYVQLNDTLKIQVLLDSGSGKNSFWFSTKLIEPLELDTANFKHISRQGEFGKTNNYYFGRLAALNTQNNLVRIEDVDALFVEGLIYEGKTGIDWLGQILTIDIANKKIFIVE